MNYDLLIKCFIAFCVGAIIYKLVSDKCSCGIVEGQGQNGTQPASPTRQTPPSPSTPPTPPTPPSPPGIFNPTPPGVGGDPNDVVAQPTEPTPGNPDNNLMDTIPINDIQDFIDTINDNIFKKSIKETISNVIGALQSDKFSEDNIPNSINAITTFEDFGVNNEALNYLELIVIEISNLDVNEFKEFINRLFQVGDYCNTDDDLNAYIISILLLEYYSIKVDNELTQEYINVSNRLSKYIPDIIEKVQKLNKNCEETGKKVKSTIMDVMVHRLFKNNNTIINIGSLDSLVNELNKLDKVYGVVILLCITYMVVRFLGMFSMKVEV